MISLLQNVQSEVEERALYLTERRCVFDSIFRQEHMEQSSRMHRVSCQAHLNLFLLELSSFERKMAGFSLRLFFLY